MVVWPISSTISANGCRFDGSVDCQPWWTSSCSAFGPQGKSVWAGRSWTAEYFYSWWEDCSHVLFSSLTIWFSEGPPHDLNVQPMGCCSSVTLTPPSTSSASSVLWVAFMGHSPAGLISLQHTCVVLNCPCTYITCHVCPFVHSYHYRHHFIIKSCFSVTVKVHSQQSPHTEYVHVLLANIKFRSRPSHPASIR